MTTRLSEDTMVEWARVQAILAVLDRIRPILRADGMNVELIEVQDKNACVRLTGSCARCGSGPPTFQSGLEEALREEIHDFGELQLVFEPARVMNIRTQVIDEHHDKSAKTIRRKGG